MSSVTQRIEAIKQPWGGYISPRSFSIDSLADTQPLFDHSEENIHPSLVGMAVDYLTRFACGSSVEKAFDISFLGAKHIGEIETARSIAESIKELDDKSIVAACKLVGFDTVYRAGPKTYRDVASINPNPQTIYNIREMVNRGIRFFEEHGPIVKDGITFFGGYTETVSHGDGDFITADTIWDFKTTVKPPTSNHTLQVCMYWLLGLHSDQADQYLSIDKLGIFNPRMGTIHTLPVSKIPKDVLHRIETEVICYKESAALF